MNNLKYIFLLGGKDIEMLEIEAILKKYEIPFEDLHLKWDNAHWLAYQETLNDARYHDKIFVGIELSGKENRPINSIDIDHHNENHENQSALEQVIRLLDVPEEWTRQRQLIAANDQGYIPAMQKLHATEKEIEAIRLADRKAQGATEEDEVKAQASIEKHLLRVENITLVYALTNRFSTLVDRLFGKADQLLIFNEETLTFYGNIQPLTKAYQQEIETNRAYYGGGLQQGYFGLAKGHWSKEALIQEIPKMMDCVHSELDGTEMEEENRLKLKQWIDQLNELNSEKGSEQVEKMYSYHIFLFPFKWTKNGDRNPYQLREFDALIDQENNEIGDWKKNDFHCSRISTPKNENYQSGFDRFNEYNYFYDHVRKMLYDMDDSMIEKTDDQQEFMHHYEYELKNKKGTYNILLRKKGEEDAKDMDALEATYCLEIDSIILNVYQTGTAVLSFHLRNHLYPDPNDILKINLFGRRISLPFFGMMDKSIYTGLPDQSVDSESFDPLQMTKENEIPNALWLGPQKIERQIGKIPNSVLYEDFSDFRNSENYKISTFILPQFIKGLFPSDFLVTENLLDKIKISPVLDDRMHVISWYGNSTLMDSLNKTHLNEINNNSLVKENISRLRKWKLDKSYSYEVSDWWYKYLYIDKDVLQTNRFQRCANIRQQTYSRFVDWGTLYGVSRYSFVMVTKNFAKTPGFLVRHLQGMYYKMVELCLLQRATILKFSDEATRLSQAVFELDATSQNKVKTDQITDDINQLYRRYIFFVNRIYFREITPQEQGIELYDLLQSTMRIPQEVKSLDEEIKELNAFVASVNDERKVIAQDKLAQESHQLTKYATVLLIPTLLAGIIGMNTMPENWIKYDENSAPFWISIALVLLAGSITWIGFKIKNNNYEK